jgi:hypothetical protein
MSGTAATRSASDKVDSATNETGDIHDPASQDAQVRVGRSGNDAFIFHSRSTANAGSAHPMHLGEVWSDANGQSWAFLHDAPAGRSRAHSQSASDGHDWLVDPGHHDGTALMHAHIADLHANAVFIH